MLVNDFIRWAKDLQEEENKLILSNVGKKGIKKKENHKESTANNDHIN